MDDWLHTKQFPTHFIAAGGLVYKEGSVLLIRSERRGWEFPGGVIERGEAILDGLKREILEESGIIAEPIEMVGIYQNLSLKEGYGPLEGHTIPPVVNIDFVCTYVSGTEERSDESVEIGWFSPEEARRLVTYPGYGERLANMLTFKQAITLATYQKASEALHDYRDHKLNAF